MKSSRCASGIVQRQTFVWVTKFRVQSVFFGGVIFFLLPINLVEGAEGGEGREFSILTAWWIKLLENLVVQKRRILYLLPEGRTLNRL